MCICRCAWGVLCGAAESLVFLGFCSCLSLVGAGWVPFVVLVLRSPLLCRGSASSRPSLFSPGGSLFCSGCWVHPPLLFGWRRMWGTAFSPHEGVFLAVLCLLLARPLFGLGLLPFSGVRLGSDSFRPCGLSCGDLLGVWVAYCFCLLQALMPLLSVSHGTAMEVVDFRCSYV